MRALKVVQLACLLGLCFGGSAFAITRYVNVSNTVPASPYTNWGIAATNIQQAINMAVTGDEILVAPGVYRIRTQVEIPISKTLTLRSTQSRAAIIDAQRLCRGMKIWGTNSLVEGFTVRNGLTNSYGGGIDISRPCTVRDCLVVSNQAYGGGGIVIDASACVVENCTIQDNLATTVGGGINFYNYSTSIVNNCIIRGNVASNYGGGVSFDKAGTVSNSWISDNRAMIYFGGGVSIATAGRLVNSVLVGNRAQTVGGGIYSAPGMVAHCTVVSNTASEAGGGIYSTHGTSWNNIVYYNVAPTNANYQSYLTVISNCCVPTNFGGSNFTNAPAFVYYKNRDFHLAAGSPCIDAGAPLNPVVNRDYDGTYRPRIGTAAGPALYDVGAFEYVPDWDVGYTSIGDGWRRLNWFGDYVPMGGAGWIWHNKHGFFYVPATSSPQNVWLYAQDMGWLYTSSTTYPFLYRSAPVAWLWYNGATNPRWFRNMTTGTWESRP